MNDDSPLNLPDAGWRKASYSVNNGACVETASTGPAVMVRDSADPSGPALPFPAAAWRDFLTAAKTPAGIPLDQLTVPGDSALASASSLNPGIQEGPPCTSGS